VRALAPPAEPYTATVRERTPAPSASTLLPEVRSPDAVTTAAGSTLGNTAAHAAIEHGGSETSAPTAVPLDFESVYAEHFDFVWRSLRLLGVPDAAAEDAAQDTFSVVLRQLSQFEGRSALRTWIFGILQRVAANHRRTRARKLDALSEFKDAPSPDPSPLAHVEARRAAASIERFCQSLDPERRALFVLGLLEGTPAAEIAAALEIPINTVYSRVHALRDGLRRALAHEEKEHGRGR
jgi:RNA polymerase sigma-70 factor (ECF subfamily)